MSKIDGFAFASERYGSSAKSLPEFRDEIERDRVEKGLDGLVSLIAQTSIWFSVELYVAMPVVLPHVLRDNECRKKLCDVGHRKTKKGNIGELRDLWSTPSPEGYVRDDNSLIKTLPKNLKIESSDAALNESTLGSNWVACHIWPMSKVRDPWLNSFVPNLVWLPKPLDVLSDRDGHPVQQILQLASLRQFLAQSTMAPGHASELFDGLMPRPIERPSFRVRNTFNAPTPWSRRRWKKVECMTRILEARAAGNKEVRKSGHSHYDGHITNLEPTDVSDLAIRLRSYLEETGGAE